SSGMASIIGGGSTNNTLIGPNTTNTWNVTSNNSGTVNGIALSAFQNLRGGTGNDTFVLGLAAKVATIVGNGGSDTLQAANVANTWNITAANSGTVAGLTFIGIANLMGGTGPDTFTFTPGSGSISGNINGGGGGDTLNYAGFSTAVTVNLATGAATAVAGTVSQIAVVIGGAGNDTLTGDSGGDVLVGNGGNDTINGGSGRSLL